MGRANNEVEIRVDTLMATSNKISGYRPDIVVQNKKSIELLFIEVGITSQD